MAGDQTYGIVGAQRYNTNTKNSTDAEAKTIWDNMTTLMGYACYDNK